MAATSERIDPEIWQKNPDQQAVFLRHLYAYRCFNKHCHQSDHCLDYGCGDGYGANLISKAVNTVHAVDVNQAAVRLAGEKYRRPNLSFKRIGAPPLPFADGSFDVIISAQVLEHLKEPQAYLKEVRRLLKNGGRLLLTTPNKKFRLRGDKPWNRYHVREYSHQELHDLLSGYFTSLKITGIFGNREIMDLEKKRVKRRQFLSDLDMFSLRKLLPGAVEYYVISAVSWVLGLGRSKNQNQHHKFSLDDFRLNNDQLDGCLDLMVEAVK